MTPVSLNTEHTDHPLVRRGLLLGGSISFLLVIFGFVRFPVLEGTPITYMMWAAIIIGVVCFSSLVGMQASWTSTTSAHLALRQGITLGLILGIIWMVYILVSHLAVMDSDKPKIGRFLTNLTFATSTFLLIVISAVGTWQTRNITTGLSIGLWAGLIAGLISFATLLVMLYLDMGFLAQHMNSGELQDFAQSGWHNRETWYFWNEELAGCVGYIITHLILGTVAGVSGGIIGKTLVSLVDHHNHKSVTEMW